MAKSKLTLGIELAGEEIRLAVLEKPEGEASGLSLHLARTVRSSEELARTLRALPRRPSAVVCALPLEGAAIRILNLPPTTDDNLERVVTLESESALPLGGEELALSHHVLGMNDQSRLEVLAAAAKLATVQEALRRVNCLPWVSAQVTVTAAALINVIEAQPGAQREETCAILRIERSSTELVVLERGRILTTQFLSVGCGDTQSAPVPEPVPVGVGGAAPAAGAAVPAPLAWVASVTQPVRFALQALAYERGLTIQRLYLCGEGATRSGAEWQIADRLDVTPIILGPPAASTSGSGDESGLYAVAYGCALQASGAAILNLNLTPARVTVAREIEQRRQTRISWGALAAAVVVSVGLVFAGAMSRRQRQLDQLNITLRELGGVSAVSTMSPSELKKSKEALDTQLLVRVPPAQMISTLSRQFPATTWLADLTYNSGTGCTIRGYSLDPSGPQRSLIALLRQRMFDEVTLDYQTEETLNNVRVWGFQLTCKLRPPEAPKRTRRKAPARGGQQ